MLLATPITTNIDDLRLQEDKPYVVLAGLDTLQGLQTARLLAAKGVPVIGLITDRNQYTGHTRVCEVLLQCPKEAAGVIDVLVQLGPKFAQKAVLIPCHDQKVRTISRERERLLDWYHVPLPEHDVLDLLIDKLRFYQFAEEQNLRIPKTYFLYNRADAESIAQELLYPVVIKPPFRTTAWSAQTSEKAFKIDDEAAFFACFDKYKPLTDVLITQRWIAGDDSTLYSCNCYYNRNGEPLATFIARKLRQYPPRTGQSSLGEEVRADEVLDETLRLFGSVAYHGLGYLEMKRDSNTGEYFIVEPNIGRPTGRSAIAEAGGVEILYTMYCDLVGLPLPENRIQQYGNVKWIHFLRDLKSAFFYWQQGELTLREWLKSMRGRKYYAIFSWRDPRPFISALMSSFKSDN